MKTPLQEMTEKMEFWRNAYRELRKPLLKIGGGETRNIFREYKEEIEDTRRRGGEYWTNIVTSLLRQVDTELGKDETNRLIRECKLEKDGWREEA